MRQDLEGAGGLEERQVEREAAPEAVRRDAEQQSSTLLRHRHRIGVDTGGLVRRFEVWRLSVGDRVTTTHRPTREGSHAHTKIVSALVALVMAAALAVAYTAPAANAAKPKHDLFAAGKEIRDTDRFVAYGKVSTFKGSRIIVQRKLPGKAYKFYKKTRRARTRASSGRHIDGPTGACFKVVVPATKKYRTTKQTHRLHRPGVVRAPAPGQTTVQVSPPPMSAASRSVGVAGARLAGGGDLGAGLVVVGRPLDLAEDADRRLVEVAGVGEPRDRERDRRVRVVGVVDEHRVLADVGDQGDLDAAGLAVADQALGACPVDRAEADRLAVDQRDDRVGLGVGCP